jgi:hypothetical protein
MPLKAMERCALVIVIIDQVRLQCRLTIMPTTILILRQGLAGRKLELQTED